MVRSGNKNGFKGSDEIIRKAFKIYSEKVWKIP